MSGDDKKPFNFESYWLVDDSTRVSAFCSRIILIYGSEILEINSIN